MSRWHGYTAARKARMEANMGEPSPPPSYEEAVSEAHRPGHEWLWEDVGSGRRMCKICGHIRGNP